MFVREVSMNERFAPEVELAVAEQSSAGLA
jgi:hypothetical protein